MTSKDKKTPPTVQRPKWPNWALILVLLSVLAPLLTIGGMLSFYLREELENRRTMAYLNFEQQGYRMREILRETTGTSVETQSGKTSLRFKTEPKAILHQTDGTWQTVSGKLSPGELAHLSPKTASQRELSLYKFNGRLLLSNWLNLDRNSSYGSEQVPAGLYLAVWNLDPNWFTEEIPSGPHLVYLINREAELLYTSATADVGEDFVKRGLVQEFIRSPLSRAGTPLTQNEKNPQLGFYMAIPESNMSLFVESSAKLLFAPLLKPCAVVIGILLGLLALIILILRDSFRTMALEINQIEKALDDFAKGYLIPTQLDPKEYLKQLQPLVESINKNTRGVRERVDIIEMDKSR